MLGFLGMKSCKGRKRFSAAPFLSMAFTTGNIAPFFLRDGVVTGKTVHTTVRGVVERDIKQMRSGFECYRIFDGLSHLLNAFGFCHTCGLQNDQGQKW